MGKTYVKDGTPVGNEHLCRSCSNAQITAGYRESELIVICNNAYPSIGVPFVVYRCSHFQDKFKPDWKQMEKLAIEIQPVRISKKTGGFGWASEEKDKPEHEPAVPEQEEGEDTEFVDAVAETTVIP